MIFILKLFLSIIIIFVKESQMSGVFCLQSVATGKVLDSNGAGNAYTLNYNHGNYQKWKVIQSGHGWANLQNVATGRFLDSNS